MTNLKEKLIEKFGICEAKEATALDSNKLFFCRGITVIAALAGEGKTTKMLSLKAIWESEGYSVSYINFDTSTNYNTELIDCPISSEQVRNFFEIIELYATDNDIVIIDSLKSIVSYTNLTIENNDEMYDFMLKLRAIIKKTHCSIILVHHTFRPKNLKNFIDNLYGARAIEEQSDSAFMYYKSHVTIVKSRLGYARDERVEI